MSSSKFCLWGGRNRNKKQEPWVQSSHKLDMAHVDRLNMDCRHRAGFTYRLSSGAGTFFGQGGLKIVRSCQRLGGEAPQTPLFSNARFYQQDTQQTYFDRHQLHARSSDRNFFRIIFYRGKQDCLLPLGFSNHARITTHVFVKCKYLNDKTKK